MYFPVGVTSIKPFSRWGAAGGDPLAEGGSAIFESVKALVRLLVIWVYYEL